jgi:histidine triad (HIT) family protein
MRRDPDCIFCKIVSNQIPAGIIHEDESCIAFLDVNPLAEGHVLVIPREHYGSPVDMTPETCAALFSVVPRLGRVLVDVTGAQGFNVLLNSGQVAGQVVPHAHCHLIPRKHGDGLGYRWTAGKYPPGRDQEVLQAYRDALAAHT